MVFLEILLGGLLLADVTSTLTCYFFHAVLHHLLLLFTEEQSTSISQVNGFSNLFLFLPLEDFTLFTLATISILRQAIMKHAPQFL